MDSDDFKKTCQSLDPETKTLVDTYDYKQLCKLEDFLIENIKGKNNSYLYVFDKKEKSSPDYKNWYQSKHPLCNCCYMYYKDACYRSFENIQSVLKSDHKQMNIDFIKKAGQTCDSYQSKIEKLTDINKIAKLQDESRIIMEALDSCYAYRKGHHSNCMIHKNELLLDQASKLHKEGDEKHKYYLNQLKTNSIKCKDAYEYAKQDKKIGSRPSKRKIKSTKTKNKKSTRLKVK